MLFIALKLFVKLTGSPTLVAATCIELFIIKSVNADLPSPRWGHAAVLLKNNIYIFGGNVVNGTGNDTTNQLLTLDVSKPFSILDPAWISLFVGPSVAYHTLSIGGQQNELLVLFCGEISDKPAPANPLFYYNTSDPSPQWNNAGLSLGERRREQKAVTRLNDSMNYFFGGIPDISSTEISSEIQFQDLFKLDTRNNLWNILNSDPNTPPGRFHHTATILPDGKMYVIGGYSKNSLVDMSKIYAYDTINAKWIVQTAAGTSPLARRAHAAVGTNDGKVIIHGGVSVDYNKLYGDVAVLDTTQSQYTWSVIDANGAIPPARYSHTATMVGTNMIIAFGFLDNNGPDNKLYVLDTLTFTWQDSYAPNNLEYTDTTPKISQEHSSSNSPNAGIIAGSTIGAVLFLFLIFGGSFWFYRRRRPGSTFYAAPYSSTKDSNSNQDKSNNFDLLSGTTAVEELPQQSMGSSSLAVPVVGTSGNGKHEKDFTALFEESMMKNDIQHTNFMMVPKSPLRVTNPDEGND